MSWRQRSGSVVCASCGNLVGVNDEKCYNCGRRNPGLWGFGPALRRLGHDLGFVPFVTGFCVVVYVLELVISGPSVLASRSLLDFLSPNDRAYQFLGAAGSIPVFGGGEWWTILSASWLHGGMLHLLFSLLWIRQLAPNVAELYGPGRMVIIYVVSGAVGFLLSSLGSFVMGVPSVSVGASAPIFGLLGAAVCYGRRTGSRMVSSQAWSYAIGMFLFGLIFPGVDNYAHAGGFAGGYLASLWLNPLKPERVKHMIGALVCLAVSILAILASVVSTLYRIYA